MVNRASTKYAYTVVPEARMTERYDHCDTIRFTEPKVYRLHLGKAQIRCLFRVAGERCPEMFWRKSPTHVCCLRHGAAWGRLAKDGKTAMRQAAAREDAGL
jgi:hypothetical protein